MEIQDFGNTAGANTSLFPGGALASSIDDRQRELMAAIRRAWNDLEWVRFGDGSGAATITVLNGTSFRVAGANVTSVYSPNRRVRAIGDSTGTIFGHIASRTFSGGNTDVTVVWDSGSLVSETVDISLGVLSGINGAFPRTINGNLDVTGAIKAGNLSIPVQTISVQRADARTVRTGTTSVLIAQRTYTKLSGTATALLIRGSVSWLNAGVQRPAAISCQVGANIRTFAMMFLGESSGQLPQVECSTFEALFENEPAGSKNVQVRMHNANASAMSLIYNPSGTDSALLPGQTESTFTFMEF